MTTPFGDRQSVSYQCCISVSCLSLTVYWLDRSKYQPEIISAIERRRRPNLTTSFGSGRFLSISKNKFDTCIRKNDHGFLFMCNTCLTGPNLVNLCLSCLCQTSGTGRHASVTGRHASVTVWTIQ